MIFTHCSGKETEVPEALWLLPD